MVEQGFVNLINTALATSLPNVTGGFAVQLHENYISKANPMSWVYRSIINTPIYVLEGQDPLFSWEVQIDCIGYSMNHAIKVANAINDCLSGSWHGVMTDPDNTRVTIIERLPSMVDGFQDANRTYVRSLEYAIHYYQT
jgi:hypothetical protein